MVSNNLPLMLQTKNVRSGKINKKRRWMFTAIAFLLGSILIFPTYFQPKEWNTKSRIGPQFSPFPWQPSYQPVAAETYKIPKGILKPQHVLFLVRTSAGLWPSKKAILRLWFKPEAMRGIIFVNGRARQPDFEDNFVEAFSEEEGGNERSVLIRMLIQGFAVRPLDVRWFVLCEDDTVFSVENLMLVLEKYDPNGMVYIGTNSESHAENHNYGHGMAFGGAGIALSYALVQTLASISDSCVQRYPRIARADQLLWACVTELGVPLTPEPGFHQFDVRGDVFGLLAAHPLAPFVSMHCWDQIQPLFPNLTLSDSLTLFMSAMETEPTSFLQQVLCYDHNANLSLSMSLRYVVQVFPSLIYPRDLHTPQITFRALNWGDHVGHFSMDTRPSSMSACEEPLLYYWKESHFDKKRNNILSIYERHQFHHDDKEMRHCNISYQKMMQQIHVQHQLYHHHWYLAPRRQCCTIEHSNNGHLNISVRPCQQLQRIYR